MRTLSFAMLLVGCATLLADEPAADSTERAAERDKRTELHEQLHHGVKPKKKTPLHKHPTVVKMLAENNAVRASVGLAEQKIDPALTKAAQDHAWYMARTGDFNHYGNGGPTGRAQRYGFPSWVRENIAYGYTTVSGAFGGWRASSGHWANMTAGESHAGFGYAVNDYGVGYWVAVYGTPPTTPDADDMTHDDMMARDWTSADDSAMNDDESQSASDGAS